MVSTVSGSRADFAAASAEERVIAESPQSAVSWPAIFGGAVAAFATTFVLVTLGAGLGLTAVSPWPNSGASLATFTIATAVWLIVVQWLASALGGYLAGRLRTKWTDVQIDEVFFRDTAHGLLAWALATVAGVLFIAAASGLAVSSGVKAAGTVAAGAAQGGTQAAAQQADTGAPTDYLVDTLFRGAGAQGAAPGDANYRGETARILTNDLAKGDVTPQDRTYLAQLVAQRTGLSQDEAQQRVDGVVAQMKSLAQKAREAADAARKATAAASVIAALAMAIGAFIAAVAAALGGRHREAY